MELERATLSSPLWRRAGRGYPSIWARRLIDRHRACIPYIHNCDLLDAGCGEGVAIDLFTSCRSITLLDKDGDAVKIAAMRARCKGRVRSVAANMASLPFPDASFDVVTCLESIEHLTRPDACSFLFEAFRVLRPGGQIILSTPVVEQGRTTGNRYHLYEWRSDDLKALLDPLFQVEDWRVDSQSPPAQWVRGRKRLSVGLEEARKAIERARDPFQQFEAVCDRLRTWVFRQHTATGFRFCADGEVSFLSTAFATLSLEALASLDDDTLRQWLFQRLVSARRPDGTFRCNDWPQCSSSDHDIGYVSQQVNYFGTHALHATGAAKESLRITRTFGHNPLSPALTSLERWKNPWAHSNRLMFVLSWLERLYSCTSDERILRQYDSVLDYLELMQDAGTGLWHPAGNCSLKQAMYAAYHFWPFFVWRQRAIPNVEAAIDSVLATQNADGTFGSPTGACEDLDGVMSLLLLTHVSEYRRADIRDALTRSFWRILQLQDATGGFPNFVRREYPPRISVVARAKALVKRLLGRGAKKVGHSATWRYSGLQSLTAKRGEPDMWSAWCRCITAAGALAGMSENGSNVLLGRFRSIPGLGFVPRPPAKDRQ